MSLFKDVELIFDGETYRVPANRVLMLIAEVEEHITLTELYSESRKLSALACGYAAALRFAGARVTDEQVYFAMFKSQSSSVTISEAVAGLLLIMVPPPDMLEGVELDDSEKKQGAAKL